MLNDTLQIRISSELKGKLVNYVMENDANLSQMIRDYLEEVILEKKLLERGYKKSVIYEKINK